MDGCIIDQYLKDNFKEDSSTIKDVFDKYDVDRDGLINQDEFMNLLCDVFKCSNQKDLPVSLVTTLMQIFDDNKDGCLDLKEFTNVWKYWLKQILKPVTAIIVVDVQNDFISGSLALKNCPANQDGAEVVKPINNLLTNTPFDVIIYSIDWHPANHISFYENRNLRPFYVESDKSVDNVQLLDRVVFTTPNKTEQVLWPTHCVQNSTGAELDPNLKHIEGGYTVYKGTNPDIDAYSAFWDNNKLSQTNLVEILLKHHVTDVYVCGLAYDICVGHTANHSTEHGFRTTLIEDASRGVSVEDMQQVKTNLQRKGVIFTHSNKISDMVNGTDRKLVHGLKAAVNYKTARHLYNMRV